MLLGGMPVGDVTDQLRQIDDGWVLLGGDPPSQQVMATRRGLASCSALHHLRLPFRAHWLS